MGTAPRGSSTRKGTSESGAALTAVLFFLPIFPTFGLEVKW